MKTNITFVTASAGSGKTYRVTEIIEDRLVKGDCRPAGLVATTYTIKAAQELRERVRRRLYDAGRTALAERLNEGLMGTVHSVCRGLLERFAFEAGISPRLEILAKEEEVTLLSQAVETATDLEMMQKLQGLADLLGQRDSKSFEYAWKKQVREVIDAVRANDFEPESLEGMAQSSVEELLDFLPPAATDNLDDELAYAIDGAVRQIGGSDDRTKATKEYLYLLKESLRDLKSSRLSWSAWVKLSKQRPGKKSETAAMPVVAAASRVESHPRLRQNIRDYTTLVFTLAQQSLKTFQQLKEERGLLDFADLEQRTLHLLQRNSEVQSILRQELDLLVVDEFQDTSPIQLALFMELAACARETVWVGDVKQAIYGFRSSDPELINAVVAEVKSSGTLAPPLSNSYRSTPELVQLTNALFVPAFQRSLALPKAQVRLAAQRPSISPSQPCVEFFRLSSGIINKGNGRPRKPTKAQYASAVAEGIAQLLERKKACRVFDQQSRQFRAAKLGDIAVLCRTNDRAVEIASALSERGLPVSLSQSGLLATPEARLAMACLRRLADRTDTLATAEIIALEGALQAEEWLESRLDYVARRPNGSGNGLGDRWGLEEPFVHLTISALDKARTDLSICSPSEALDVALASANVFASVSAWGPNATRTAQRRANLESLRALAVKYEQACAAAHGPATIAGFLFWCDDLAEWEKDERAADEGVNAIHIVTYHSAKGLEWPIVICADLESEARPRYWEVTTIIEDPSKPFDPSQPLANRRLRFWPWPFGQQEKGIPLPKLVEASELGQRINRTAEQEELRLLYVGLTRARDLLILVLESDQPAPWLESLQATWLNPDVDPMKLPGGGTLSSKTALLTPPVATPPPIPESNYFWFPAPVVRTPKLTARLTPSSESPVTGAQIGREINFGSRLPVAGKPKEETLGDALHAILAADFVNSVCPNRNAIAERILRGHELNDVLKEGDALVMVDRLRKHIVAAFQPRQVLVEVPFSTANQLGQRVSGFMDMLLETDRGWVVIDHKSFQGKRSDWAAKAISFSGQLALYRKALANLGKPIASLWIHFAVSGGMVEVKLG